ncbi:MAG: putative metalloprotease CJM1_0395 family protein [Planctomycetota bacterium]
MSAVATTLTNPSAGLAFVAPPRTDAPAPSPSRSSTNATAPRDTARFSTEARLASSNETESKSEPSNLGGPRGTDGQPLTEAEQQQVRELQARDREVKAHEQAHKNAAGQYATSGPTYTYQTGPDGKRYAVGGSVGIDVSPEDTPEETLRKMEVVRRAALAPGEPSAQDRRVAAQATRTANQARQELNAQRAEEASGNEDTADNPDTVTASTTTTSTDAFRTRPNDTPTLDVIA